MLSEQYIQLLGSSFDEPLVEDFFQKLDTLTRPSLDEDEPEQHYDWVLVRRKGVELGFVDAGYLAGRIRPRKHSGELILNQLTFYNGTREGVSAYIGELPHGLTMHDTRAVVRQRLFAYESTLHSYVTDRWNIDTYRLVIAYKPNDAGLDSVHLKLPIAPLDELGRQQPQVRANKWLELFGKPANDPRLIETLQPLNIAARIEDDEDDREVEFLEECGLGLYFEEENKLKFGNSVKGRQLVLGAVKFFRARDRDARQYSGELPFGLSFDDSAETLYRTVRHSPYQQDDGTTTGYALWHFEQYSLHVLYSTIENHLFRITLMAPGYWQDRSEAG